MDAAAAPETRRSYLRWDLVDDILTTRQCEIEAISLSLPAHPTMVRTPPLLRRLTGADCWPERMVSHKLIKLYIAVVFHACADVDGKHRGDHFDRAYKALQAEQRAALAGEDRAAFDHEADGEFLLAYIHAYERFVLKYLHLLNVGGDVSLAADADGAPPLSYFVLHMEGKAAEHFREVMTSIDGGGGKSKELDDVRAAMDDLRARLEAAEIDDEKGET